MIRVGRCYRGISAKQSRGRRKERSGLRRASVKGEAEKSGAATGDVEAAVVHLGKAVGQGRRRVEEGLAWQWSNE